jgi:hypothetical protein
LLLTCAHEALIERLEKPPATPVDATNSAVADQPSAHPRAIGEACDVQPTSFRSDWYDLSERRNGKPTHVGRAHPVHEGPGRQHILVVEHQRRARPDAGALHQLEKFRGHDRTEFLDCERPALAERTPWPPARRLVHCQQQEAGEERGHRRARAGLFRCIALAQQERRNEAAAW